MKKYPVVTLQIPQEYIPWAMEKTTAFDKVKGHNKFECENNWIGILGERLFSDFLKSQGVEHKWHGEENFDQGNYTTPDFTILVDDDFTIDVKTASHRRDLMFPRDCKDYFKYFVMITLNHDKTEAYIQGFIPRVNAMRYKKVITRDNGNQSRCVPIDKLKSIWGLVGGWD